MTVRGENLGTSADDLLGLIICGVDCFMYSEWVSPSKILTRSGRCRGVGDVIVATRSGGIGSCTVQFRGYEEPVTLTKDSAVWVDEEELLTAGPSRGRTTSSPTLAVSDPLGLPLQDAPPDIDGATLLKAEITNKDFDPSLYLATKHHSATFSDLKRGLGQLKGRTAGQTCGPSPVALLKPNVLAIVECVDGLKNVHSAQKKDKQELGTEMTSRVEDLLKKMTGDAHQIFDAILARKDLSDSTRNALNVLQRYRFLFNLPSSIERSIQKGDYDSVVNDFSRGRSLFEDTQVKVFRKVFLEVEQRVDRFKKVLEDKLRLAASDPDSRSFDQLKKLIRHLVSLGGNPAWSVIVTLKETLWRKLDECQEKFDSTVMSQNSSKNQNSCKNQNRRDLSPETPETVVFIEELISIFRRFFPDLVKIGREYLDGNLYSRESEQEMEEKERIFQSEMIDGAIKKLVRLMRSALIPSSGPNFSPSGPSFSPSGPNSCFSRETSDRTVIWLPHCLRCINECHRSVMHQEGIGPSSLLPVQELAFEFRVHSLSFLMNQASEEVRRLYTRENWEVLSESSVGTRTHLPLLFESRVSEVVQLVRETVITPSSAEEGDILTQINVQGQVKQLSQSLLQSFILTLEKTVPEKRTPDYDDHILLVISNCAFTSTHSLPRILDVFEKHSYPDMNMVVKVTQAKCRDLENRLLKTFTETKSDAVITSIEPAMFSHSNHWFAPSTRPTEVSFYVKDTLMNLIHLEAQIFSVAPVLVKKVLVEVIDAAVEEIARLQECVADRFNEWGNLQAVIDFSALQIAFRNIDSHSTERLLHSTPHLNPLSTDADRESLGRIIKQLNISMQLQLLCFNWETDQTVIAI